MSSPASPSTLPVTFRDVQEAMERVRGAVHYTPVMTSSYLNSLAGHQLFFKCEIFQKAGSFKVCCLMEIKWDMEV